MPQTVKNSENYFDLLGVAKKFRQDRQQLEKNFYVVSRALHPDRFTSAKLEAKTNSLSRMSLMNQAYGVLKDPHRLREYFLKLEGVSLPKSAMPAELAEDWFEIQDLLMDDPSAARGRVLDFENHLIQVRKKSEENLREFEQQYDLQAAPDILNKIAQEMQSESYLSSLQRDVERIKKNASSN
jgi:molecular chaperone HscB